MSGVDRTHQKPHDTSIQLSSSDAVVAVLVGGVAVDGVLKTEEARRLQDALSSTRWLLGTGVDRPADLTKRALDLIGEHGLAAVLDACGKAIPAELRATTFALATDLVLVDGRLSGRESGFIDRVQRALQIDNDLARRIVEVLVIKNRVSGPPDV